MGQPPPTAEFLYEAAGLLSPDIAVPGIIVVSLASLALTFWVLTWPFSFWRQGRKRMEGVLTSVPPLPGLITITGKVAYASDANVAVRLEITQEGKEEESSGQWSQTWTETDRNITVAPFELELEDGKRLRVEPTRNVLFTDAFNKKVLVNRTTRVRTAELEPGERIWVDGELVPMLDPSQPQGYRGSGTVLVLKDSARNRMRISSERLDAPHDKNAHWWLLVGLGCLLGSAIFQVSLSGYYLRAWYGGTNNATVVGRHVEDGGDSADEYLVDVRLEDGKTASVPVDQEYLNDFKDGTTMAVRRVRGISWFVQAGPRASVYWIHFVGAALILAIVAVVIVALRWGPWDKFDKGFNETEPGRLS